MTNENQNKKIKCVVWDLDNTIWDGILLEDKEVKLRENVINVIKILDERGILNSIASKNEHEIALAKLKEFGILDYFLAPQINWNPKYLSIKQISEELNIGIDTFAFVDDQMFELDSVKHYLPEVPVINAENVFQIPKMPMMQAVFITQDSKLRRKMYMNDIKRKEIEDSFAGSQQDFLASLEMKFSIEQATEADLQRAEELTLRTNQLNSTGYTYSYDELKEKLNSDEYCLLVASLEDKYGTYGKIGLALIKKESDTWVLHLLLMSCRVMSRGVGNLMLSYIINQAKQQNTKLLAYFVPTDRNRMMYMTYKFAGFQEKEKIDDRVVLEHDMLDVHEIPSYVTLYATSLGKDDEV
jgi:FkbH-like protein